MKKIILFLEVLFVYFSLWFMIFIGATLFTSLIATGTEEPIVQDWNVIFGLIATVPLLARIAYSYIIQWLTYEKFKETNAVLINELYDEGFRDYIEIPDGYIKLRANKWLSPFPKYYFEIRYNGYFFKLFVPSMKIEINYDLAYEGITKEQCMKFLIKILEKEKYEREESLKRTELERKEKIKKQAEKIKEMLK